MMYASTHRETRGSAKEPSEIQIHAGDCSSADRLIKRRKSISTSIQHPNLTSSLAALCSPLLCSRLSSDGEVEEIVEVPMTTTLMFLHHHPKTNQAQKNTLEETE